MSQRRFFFGKNGNVIVLDLHPDVDRSEDDLGSIGWTE